MIRPVRQFEDGRPHGGLTAALDLAREVGEIGQSVILHEDQQPVLHEIERHDLGVEIAHRLVGRAHVLADQRDQSLVGLPRRHHLHRRDLQPLLEDLARLGAADLATDVGHVCRRGTEGDQPAVSEDRLGQRHVGQMAGAKPDVVGDQHVAGRKLVFGEVTQEVLHRLGQGADEARDALARLDQRLARGIGHNTGEVVALTHQGRERRANHRRGGLVDQRNQPPPQQLEFYGIEGAAHGKVLMAGSAPLQWRSWELAADKDAPLEWRAPGKDFISLPPGWSRRAAAAPLSWAR